MEKTKVRVAYKLYISGNDLDAKAAQKLKAGDELKLVRLDVSVPAPSSAFAGLPR